eukprot:gene7229-5080_t
MEARVPTNALRPVPLAHAISSRRRPGAGDSVSASIAANTQKWKRFGVSVEQYVPDADDASPAPPPMPARPQQLTRTYSALATAPRDLPPAPADWMEEFSCRSQHELLDASSTPSGPSPHSQQPAAPPPRQTVDAGRDALAHISEMLSQAEQARRCGPARRPAPPQPTPWKCRRANMSDNAEPSRKRAKNGDGANAVEKAPPRKRKSKAAAQTTGPPAAAPCLSPLPLGPPVSPPAPKVPFEHLASHEDAAAMIASIRAALEDPNRIQAPPLFVGLLLLHCGLYHSSFALQPDSTTAPWRADPNRTLQCVSRYGFRWQDKVYLMVPEVGLAFLQHVLQELVGVEVITYNAPFVLVPLLLHAGGALHSSCISDTRVMAWMSAAVPPGVLTPYSSLYMSVLALPKERAWGAEEPIQEFAQDVFSLAPLYRSLYAALGSRSLLQPFLRQEKRVALLLAQMKCNGVRVDLRAVRQLKVRCLAQMDAAKARAAALLPSMPDFNIQSSDQCRHALYTVLELGQHLRQGATPTGTDAVSITKTGKLSTADETLRLLAPHHELPGVIRDYRKAAKMIQNYIEGMLQTAVPVSDAAEERLPSIFDEDLGVGPHAWLGRSVVDDQSIDFAALHPNFLQEGTDTGRLSCTEPNLQNLPRSSWSPLADTDACGEDELAFRHCFVAPPGYVLVSIDYEQIELRVLAHLSGDPALIDALTHAADIHRRIAELVFRKPSVSAEERSTAKRMVFGTLYGAGSKSMAAQLGMSVGQASEISRLVQASFPQVDRYRRQLVEEGRAKGAVRTMSGRTRRLPDLASALAAERSYGERQAFNTVVQGSAADVMKLAMLAVERNVLEKYPRDAVQLTSQIHDELVFCVRSDMLTGLVPQLEAAMVSAASLRVPLPVVVKYGPSLGSLQPWTVDDDLGLQCGSGLHLDIATHLTPPLCDSGLLCLSVVMPVVFSHPASVSLVSCLHSLSRAYCVCTPCHAYRLGIWSTPPPLLSNIPRHMIASLWQTLAHPNTGEGSRAVSPAEQFCAAQRELQVAEEVMAQSRAARRQSLRRLAPLREGAESVTLELLDADAALHPAAAAWCRDALALLWRRVAQEEGQLRRRCRELDSTAMTVAASHRALRDNLAASQAALEAAAVTFGAPERVVCPPCPALTFVAEEQLPPNSNTARSTSVFHPNPIGMQGVGGFDGILTPVLARRYPSHCYALIAFCGLRNVVAPRNETENCCAPASPATPGVGSASGASSPATLLSFPPSHLIRCLGLQGVFVSTTEEWIRTGLGRWEAMVQQLNCAPWEERVIGVDIEWFKKNPVAVLQIASATHCFVFHVSYLTPRALPDPVRLLLERPDVVKCGVNVNGDAKKIQADAGVVMRSTMNVEQYAELLLSVGVGCHGLQGLTSRLLGLDMPHKKTTNVTRSNWELPLSDIQREYAADDAVASYALGRFLVDTAARKSYFTPNGSQQPNPLTEWLRQTESTAAQTLKSVVRQHSKAYAKAQMENKAKAAGSTDALPPAKMPVNIPVTVLDREGVYLFKCNQSQAKFYTVDRGIANVLEFYPNTHKPSKIQLLFDPRRKTRLCVYFLFHVPCTDNCPFAHGIDDLMPESRLLLDDPRPSCAICLSVQSLIRHAVVPPSLRRHLPPPLQNPREEDFIPICRQCQTAIVDKVRRNAEHIQEQATKVNPQLLKNPNRVRRCCSYARLLSNPQKLAVVPPDKVAELLEFVAAHSRQLGLLRRESDADEPPKPIDHVYPPLTREQLEELAKVDATELQQMTVVNSLVGTDVEKGRAFVESWWQFMYDECCCINKPSNRVSSEEWKNLKKRADHCDGSTELLYQLLYGVIPRKKMDPDSNEPGQTGVEDRNQNQVKERQLVDLILYKHEATKRIEALESALRKIKPSLMDASVAEMVEKTKLAHQHFSLEAGEEDETAQIVMWNNELMDVVDKMQKTLQRVENEANAKLSTMTSEMEALVYENATLVKENESLKERVADDVLRKRLANRIEMAAEKAKIAALVRAAGLRRLEFMEGNLMEAHDDMYHRQRYDAVDVPQRDVCFVFHYVSNLTFPLRGAEEVTMNVCKQIMANSQRQRHGHRVASYRGMEVFVFQDPYAALDFAQHCHQQVLQFRHHEREDLPHFSALYEQGVAVFRGPRLHTCIFACTPEVEVDPVSGESVYFGPEVRAAVSAALQFSAVGEIVVNKRWAQLICRRHRYLNDSNVPVRADVTDMRESLGRDWDVMEMPGAGGIVFSILPARLRGRRSVDPGILSPSPKYPCMDLEVQEGIVGIVKALKNASDNASKHQQHIWAASAGFSLEDDSQGEDDVSGPMRMLEYFTLKQEKDNVTALYHDLERASECFERNIMAQEDRYEILNRAPPDPSETVYVVTVDFGDDNFWKQIVVSTMTAQEYKSLRESIRCYIHTQAMTYFGFLMNGNDVDIFTYMFRSVESAFTFISDVYIMVNRTGTKCSHATQGSGQDVFFLRAGMTCGPMSSIYRVQDKGTSSSVKGTGAIIRLSGTLTDLSQNGEILATEGVIKSFLSVNENLLDAQFNIVRQRGQYLGSSATPASVHSILPKPFAYRRKQLLRSEKEGRRPSRCAAMALEGQRTDFSKIMVEDLLVQQRERQELMEASLMAAQDKPEITAREIRNPWFLTAQANVPLQPYGTHPNYKPPVKPIAFFYCDVMSSIALERDLSPAVLQKMYGHYNHIVQSVLLQSGGCVIKSNARAAYLVIFPTVFQALEAAMLVQERLHSSTWPEEMKTAESCLLVKDAKTGDVVFNGPRAQVAVHVSTAYTWKRNGGEHHAVEMTGPALDEILYLGYHAHAGEIRFSQQCIEHLKSTSGQLLLQQLQIEMQPSPHFGAPMTRRSSSASLSRKEGGGRRRSSITRAVPQVSIEAVTAVPRSIEGRMPFLLPGGLWIRASSQSPDSGAIEDAHSSLGSQATDLPRPLPTAPLATNPITWFYAVDAGLPVATEGDWDERSDVVPAEAREIQFFAEHVLSKFPGGGLDVGHHSVVKSVPPVETPYNNFMRFLKELMGIVVRAFNYANDRVKPPPIPKISIPKSKLPLAGGRGARIPTAPSPPSAPKQRRDRDSYEDALDYLDESWKFLSKLKGLQAAQSLMNGLFSFEYLKPDTDLVAHLARCFQPSFAKNEAGVPYLQMCVLFLVFFFWFLKVLVSQVRPPRSPEASAGESRASLLGVIVLYVFVVLRVLTFGWIGAEVTQARPPPLSPPEMETDDSDWVPSWSPASALTRMARHSWLPRSPGNSNSDEDDNFDYRDVSAEDDKEWSPSDINEARLRRDSVNRRIRAELAEYRGSDLTQCLKVQACTWNVDQRPPPESGSHEFLEFLVGKKLADGLRGASAAHVKMLLPDFPDLLVVTLQEVEKGSVVLMRESTRSSKKWVDAIQEAINGASCGMLPYWCIKSVQLVGLVFIVMVQKKHRPFISHTRVSLTRCGVMRVLGNKGAVAIRVTIYGRRFLLIAAHFAAHKYNEERRARDYHATVADLKFELPGFIDDELDVLETFLAATPMDAQGTDKEQTMKRGPVDRVRKLFSRRMPPHMEHQILDQHDYVFFLGDLNSRLHGVELNSSLEMIQRCQFDELLIHDELRQAMVCGEGFDGFEELWIAFPPTYKYEVGADAYVTNNREPAWCDRILFRIGSTEGGSELATHSNAASSPLVSPVCGGSSTSSPRQHQRHASTFPAIRVPHAASARPPERFPMFTNAIRPKTYACIGGLRLSDHRPVCANFIVDVLALPEELVVRVLEEVSKDSISLTPRRKPLGGPESAQRGINEMIFFALQIETRGGRPLQLSLLPFRSSAFIRSGTLDCSLRLNFWYAFGFIFALGIRHVCHSLGPNVLQLFDFLSSPSFPIDIIASLWALLIVLQLLLSFLIFMCASHTLQREDEEQSIFRQTDDIMLERDVYRNGAYGFARNKGKGTTPRKPGPGISGSNSPRPAEPRLRSKVLLTKPSANPDHKYIRLDTYHDSSDVYRALAKIQEACDYGLNEEEELDKMTSHNPSVLTGPWLQRKERPATVVQINDMPADVLLRCFAFCDLRTLGTLCAVSNRFYVLANTHSLWLPHAEARRVPLSDPRNARRELREFILRKRREKDREVQQCEDEYELLSRRMKERSEAIKLEPVNIEETLGSHNPNAILHGTYTKSDGGKVLVSTTFVKKMQETLVQLEELRDEVMDRMDKNNSMLNRQQEELLRIERRLDGDKRSDNNASEEMGPLTLPDLLAFERRMVRLVLSGSGLAPATSSSRTDADTPQELPVAIRRGIIDFGTVELLCLDTTLPENVIKPVKTRFAAFKRFFPLGDDYYTVRAVVESCVAGKPVPRKCEAILEKITALIQRIQRMTDGEAMSVVFHVGLRDTERRTVRVDEGSGSTSACSTGLCAGESLRISSSHLLNAGVAEHIVVQLYLPVMEAWIQHPLFVSFMPLYLITTSENVAFQEVCHSVVAPKTREAIREDLIMEILGRDKEIFELKRQHELSMLRVEQHQKRILKDQEDRGMYYEQNCNVHTFDTVSVGLHSQRTTLYHTMSLERLRNVKIVLSLIVTVLVCWYIYYRYMVNPDFVYVEKPMKMLGSRVQAIREMQWERLSEEEKLNRFCLPFHLFLQFSFLFLHFSLSVSSLLAPFLRSSARRSHFFSAFNKNCVVIMGDPFGPSVWDPLYASSRDCAYASAYRAAVAGPFSPSENVDPAPGRPGAGFGRRPPPETYKGILPPPGVAFQLSDISPSEVDTSAEAYVQQWLQENKHTCWVGVFNTKKDLPVFDVPHTIFKRGVLNFRINGHEVYAIGQSRKKKVARLLCFMHARSLLHFYQSVRPQDASPPPGLQLVEGGAIGSKPAMAPPAQDVETSYYLRMQIPPSSNTLVNRAAELVYQDLAQRRVDGNTQLVQQLSLCIPGARKQLISVQVDRKVHVVNYAIDKSAGLIATGIGPNPKLAKQRCAAHALHILTLYKESLTSTTPVPGLSKPGETKEDVTSLAALIQSLPKHNQMLYRFLHRLFNIVPKRSFELREDSAVCHITLDGLRCQGEGINCFEAERRATDNAISEMQLYDERVSALNTFISTYHIAPESIPRVTLPGELVERIAVLSAREQELFNAEDASVFEDSAIQKLTEEEKLIRSLGGARSPDPGLAQRLQQNLSAFRTDPAYLRGFHERRSTLAMAGAREQLLATVRQHQVTVIAGTTGCGKTTQVPQYLFDDAIAMGVGDKCSILVTQPRRLSTYSVANRIASERLSSVGGDVGYAVRLDAVPGRHINICTSGVLLQILGKHPHLEHITHLILDEVHERDVNCDFILALVKDVIQHNPTIRVLLMSATIEASLFSDYFGAAPVIKVTGAVYPVVIHHLEDIHKMEYGTSLPAASPATPRKMAGPPPPPKWIDYDLIAALVFRSAETHLRGGLDTKSILVFLPGWKELVAGRQAIEAVRTPKGSPRPHIIILHSSVDSATQRTCFMPPPPGTFKVVLATNIAESGITIDGVAVVIDTGLIKETAWVDHRQRRGAEAQAILGDEEALGVGYSSGAMSTQLSLKYASLANCIQRTGRAGRTQGGVCYRLFTKRVEAALRDFPEPEIRRLPLSQVLLKCLSLGHPPRTFLQEFIEPPQEKHVAYSMDQLQSLGAVTQAEQLTPLGHYLSRLPCDPRTGKMILMGAVLRCLDSTLTIAAAADLTPFTTNRLVAEEVKKRRFLFARNSQSDQIAALNAYNAFCANSGDTRFANHNHLSTRQLYNISQYKQQYLDILYMSGFIRADRSSAAFRSGSELSSPDDAAMEGAGGLTVDTSPLSAYALDVALVKACVASCLYPHIAVLDVESRRRGKQKLLMRIRSVGSITPGSSSVCRTAEAPSKSKGGGSTADFLHAIRESSKTGPPSMFFVYQDTFQVQESRTQFLTDVSSISLWGLLLFCGNAESFVTYNEVLGIGVIQGWIGVLMDKATYEALLALRQVMDNCLMRKFRDPFDEQNNAMLDQVCQLCRDVLRSPVDDDIGNNDGGAAWCTLLDMGSIVPPTRGSSSSPTSPFTASASSFPDSPENFWSIQMHEKGLLISQWHRPTFRVCRSMLLRQAPLCAKSLPVTPMSSTAHCPYVCSGASCLVPRAGTAVLSADSVKVRGVAQLHFDIPPALSHLSGPPEVVATPPPQQLIPPPLPQSAAWRPALAAARSLFLSELVPLSPSPVVKGEVKPEVAEAAPSSAAAAPPPPPTAVCFSRGFTRLALLQALMVLHVPERSPNASFAALACGPRHLRFAVQPVEAMPGHRYTFKISPFRSSLKRSRPGHTMSHDSLVIQWAAQLVTEQMPPPRVVHLWVPGGGSFEALPTSACPAAGVADLAHALSPPDGAAKDSLTPSRLAQEARGSAFALFAYTAHVAWCSEVASRIIDAVGDGQVLLCLADPRSGPLPPVCHALLLLLRGGPAGDARCSSAPRPSDIVTSVVGGGGAVLAVQVHGAKPALEWAPLSPSPSCVVKGSLHDLATRHRCRIQLDIRIIRLLGCSPVWAYVHPGVHPLPSLLGFIRITLVVGNTPCAAFAAVTLLQRVMWALCLSLVLLLSLFARQAAAGAPMCVVLSGLSGLNSELLDESSIIFDSNELYFCSDDAPLVYHCRCPIMLKCATKKDLWGRNIGVCTCCRGFMTAFFIIIGCLLLLGVALLLYTLVCSNRWWCDGYPAPLRIKMPRRGPIVPCPPGPVLPRNLFQGYRRNHFLDVQPGNERESADPQLFQIASPQPQRPAFELLQQERQALNCNMDAITPLLLRVVSLSLSLFLITYLNLFPCSYVLFWCCAWCTFPFAGQLSRLLLLIFLSTSSTQMSSAEPSEADLIYQNEVLKMELEELKAELDAAGVHDLQALQQERDQLVRELQVTQVRLEERTEQVRLLSSSQDMFSNIDTSVQQLMNTVRQQEADMAELKDALGKKDLVIAQLRREIDELRKLEKEHAALLEAENQVSNSCETQVYDLQQRVDQLQDDHDALVNENVSLRMQLKKARDGIRAANESQGFEAQRDTSAAVAEVVERYERQLQAERDTVEALRVQLAELCSKDNRHDSPSSGFEMFGATDRATKHKRSLDSLQSQMNALLHQEDVNPKEIRRLIEVILDTQDKLYEEMNNALAIKDLQMKDKEDVLRCHLRRLEKENRSLTALYHDRLPRAPTEASNHADPEAPAAVRPPVTCPRCTLVQQNVNGLLRVIRGVLHRFRTFYFAVLLLEWFHSSSIRFVLRLSLMDRTIVIIFFIFFALGSALCCVWAVLPYHLQTQKKKPSTI